MLIFNHKINFRQLQIELCFHDCSSNVIFNKNIITFFSIRILVFCHSAPVPLPLQPEKKAFQ